MAATMSLLGLVGSGSEWTLAAALLPATALSMGLRARLQTHRAAQA